MSQAQDHTKMKVDQLLSALAEHGVTLPANKQRKAYYVDLYEREILKREPTPVTATPVKSRKSVASKRRRTTANSKSQTEEDSQPTTQTEDDYEEASQPSQTQSQTIETQEDEPQKKRARIPEEDEDMFDESNIQPQTTQQPPRQSVTTFPPVNNRTTTVPSNIGFDSLARTSGLVITQQPTPVNNQPPRRATMATGNFGTSNTLGNNVGVQGRKSYGFINPALQQNTVDQHFKPQYEQPQTPPDQVNLSADEDDVDELRQSPSRTDYSTKSLTPSQVERRVNKEPESNGVGYLALFIYGIIFMCVYFIVTHRSGPQLPHGKPYCDTEFAGSPIAVEQNLANCQPCPEHGYCAEGHIIECQAPYILMNAICVKDETVDKLAMKIVLAAQNRLAHQRGDYECRNYVTYSPQNQYPESKGRTTDQLREDLRADFVDRTINEVDVDEALYENSFKAFLDQIKETPDNFELEVEKIPDDDFSQNKEMIYSTNPVIPITCRMEKKFRENRTFILGALAVVILILLGNFIKQKIDQDRLDLEDLIRIVLTRLREKRKVMMLILKADLKEEYPEINVDKLWPKVRDVICGEDPRVDETTDSITHNLVWVWRADDKMSASPVQKVLFPEEVGVNNQ